MFQLQHCSGADNSPPSHTTYNTTHTSQWSVVMVHLCTPYDDGITCLCDDNLDVNILKLVEHSIQNMKIEISD